MWIPESTQRKKRLQKGLLHDVICVVRITAQPQCTGSSRRPVALDKQPEGRRVTTARQLYQVTVGKFHAY